MWKQQKLQLSPQAKTLLESMKKGIVSPFSLSTKGTKLGVHNWSHGIEEKSNRYLSPENAVKALSAKLLDYADPNRPKGKQQLIAIMVTSNNIEQFITDLEQVSILLPEPCFKQALDYAKSSKDLQQTKMVKTPTINHPAFTHSADITPGSNRTMQSILRNAASAAQSMQASAPMDAIRLLIQQKQQREQQNQQKIQQLLNIEVSVQAFSTSGYLEQIAVEMQGNIPNGMNVFTACVMYIGSDLSAIRGMLNEYH